MGDIARATIVVAALAATAPCIAANNAIPVITPKWHKTTIEVRTDLSIQVCVEPPLRGNSPIKRRLFNSLRTFHSNYARLHFWYPYPRLAVAELEPPGNGETHWDFSLIDPIVESFYTASEGRPVMLNFSTPPQWMYKTEEAPTYPADPGEIAWKYGQGAELRDPTLAEIREYYRRLASWYVLGGFVDEFGRKHESGHRFTIDYWEVLNEVDTEHNMSPELYTRVYDEVVEAVKKVSPRTHFSGLALGIPANRPEYFEYFLNPRNHKPNIPLDMISYHFYAFPEVDESSEVQQFTLFRQADAFVSTVKYIEAIRTRLSPTTKTYLNEVGTWTARPLAKRETIPATYWHLSGAVFAYLYIQLLKLQIDLVAGAELIDYPGQVAGASLSDWNTGLPNARFQVLKLLHEEIRPGDRLIEDIEDESSDPERPNPLTYSIQGVVAQNGRRKLLIVNKRNRPLVLRVVGSAKGEMNYTDVSTGTRAAVSVPLRSDKISLNGFAVAVVTMPKRQL